MTENAPAKTTSPGHEIAGNPDAARRLTQKATLITSATAFGLILMKLTVGLTTGSITVLASAVDSCLDFLVSAFNAVATRQAGRPSDEAFNYGRGKLEGLAASFEGGFILVSAGYIGWQAMARLMRPQVLEAKNLDIAVIVMAVSLGVTYVLVRYLGRSAAQAAGNIILEADALHYRTDLWTGVGVLLSLFAIRLTGWNWLDPVIALGLAAYIAGAALPLLRKGLEQLLDRALDPVLIDRIRSVVASHAMVNGMHEMRSRRAGDTNFIDFHLVLSESMTLGQAHRISDEIENRIRALDPSRWSIQIHLDPVDDSRRDQRLRGQS